MQAEHRRHLLLRILQGALEGRKPLIGAVEVHHHAASGATASGAIRERLCSLLEGLLERLAHLLWVLGAQVQKDVMPARLFRKQRRRPRLVEEDQLRYDSFLGAAVLRYSPITFPLADS